MLKTVERKGFDTPLFLLSGTRLERVRDKGWILYRPSTVLLTEKKENLVAQELIVPPGSKIVIYVDEDRVGTGTFYDPDAPQLRSW